MKKARTLISTLVIAFALSFAIGMGSTAQADHSGKNSGKKKSSILGTLARTDGSQALVAAVRVGEEFCAEVGDLLDSRRNRVTLLAPSNEAFATLLGLDPSAFDGLEIDAIASVLPALLANVGLDTEALCGILLNHVSVSRRGPPRSESRLLADGLITMEDGSRFVVGIGENGVCINRESCITKPNVYTQNDVIHFLDRVIQDIPPDDPEPPPDDTPSAIDEWCSRDACVESDAQFDRCVAFMEVCLTESQTQPEREKCSVAGLLICSEISPGEPGGPGGPNL